MGRRGRAAGNILWDAAEKLAKEGVYMSEASRKLGVHHTTAMYIARKRGFKWPAPPEDRACWGSVEVRRFVPRSEPVPQGDFSRPPSERIERMLDLARRCA